MNPILEVGAMSGSLKRFEGHRAGGLTRVGVGFSFPGTTGWASSKSGRLRWPLRPR